MCRWQYVLEAFEFYLVQCDLMRIFINKVTLMHTKSTDVPKCIVTHTHTQTEMGIIRLFEVKKCFKRGFHSVDDCCISNVKWNELKKCVSRENFKARMIVAFLTKSGIFRTLLPMRSLCACGEPIVSPCSAFIN